MKLSEAMRRGAAIRPQCRDLFFHEIDGRICSCALGAAFEGAGLATAEVLDVIDERDLAQFDGLQPWLVNGPSVLCPVSHDCALTRLTDQIIHLNDDHLWTREAIADWLESIGY